MVTHLALVKLSHRIKQNNDVERSSAGKKIGTARVGGRQGVGRNRIHYTHVLNCQRRNFFNKKKRNKTKFQAKKNSFKRIVGKL